MSDIYKVVKAKRFIFPVIFVCLLLFGPFQNCERSRLGFATATSIQEGLGFGDLPDADGDGLPDDEETRLGTDPNNADTDGDGLSDGAEVNRHLTDPLKADTDGGGIDDGVEVNRGSDPLNPSDDIVISNVDTDLDGLTDDEEKTLGTDPTKADTDGDGLKDGEEVKTHGTDPLNPDTDGGGVTDGAEVRRGTDPKVAADDFPPVVLDFDGDGLSDDEEVRLGTDPKNPDTDGDGLTDGEEVLFRLTDPLKKDTDGGGVDDGVEIKRGTNPKNPADDIAIDPLLDTDLDGLTDVEEKTLGTNPNDADTDKDGLSDGAEVNTYKTNPLNPDTDSGGVTDGAEVKKGTDPLVGDDDFPTPLVDSDKDGLTDDEEKKLGTDPFNPDTDGDFLTDGSEVNTYKTNPLNPDTDGGGVYDGVEVVLGGNPLDPKDDDLVNGTRDTDGDGLTDKQEDLLGTNKNLADTDGDGLTDGAEVNTYKTSPVKADTDGGGVNDGIEVNRGTNPLNSMDDQTLAAQCKYGSRLALYIDPLNSGDINQAIFVEDVTAFSGSDTGAKNYSYKSSSGHPIKGPTPKANQFNAYLYQGSDGLSLGTFQGEDNQGDNRNEKVSYNIYVLKNDRKDKVLLSDDGGELKASKAVTDGMMYAGRFKYSKNTDGGVIGPLMTDNFVARVEMLDSTDVTEAYFVSGDGKKINLLDSGGKVRNFIVGKTQDLNCEAGTNKIIFKKLPTPTIYENKADFLFHVEPTMAGDKVTCILDKAKTVACKPDELLTIIDLGLGQHSFNVIVEPTKGQPFEAIYKFEVLPKPVPPPVAGGSGGAGNGKTCPGISRRELAELPPYFSGTRGRGGERYTWEQLYCPNTRGRGDNASERGDNANQ